MVEKPTYEELERRVRELESALSVQKKAKEALRKSEERVQHQKAVITELALEKAFADFDLKRSFEKMCEFLAEAIDVARTSVWELSDDGSELRCVSLYRADNKSHSRGPVLNAGDFPDYFDTIKVEGRLSSEDVQNDPRTRKMTENYLKPLGITSMLDAGIIMDGTLIGVVCAEHVGERRRWHSDEEAFVNIIAAYAAKRFAEFDRMKADKRYRELAESISDVFFAMDRDLKYTYWNKACEMLEGIPAEKAIGKDLFEILPDNESRELVKNKFLQVIETKKPEQLITRYPGNEQIVHEINIYPNSEGVSVIVKDITEHKKLEQEREKAIIELEEALSEIKTLRGILPLCSFCKKIRDDKGYWEKVDVYIRKHLQADISHSICPGCMKKQYPDLYKEK
jgi:PAS domain S-box-containing protein